MLGPMHRYGYNPLSVGDRLGDDKFEVVRRLGWAGYSRVTWLGSTSQFLSTPSTNTSFKNESYSANDVSSIT